MTSDFDDLTQTSDDRRRIFRPDWFRDLLAGRLGLGDSFWIGNYGVALLWLPLSVLIAVILGATVSEGAMLGFLFVVELVVGLYLLALTRAVFLAARRTPQVGGWRWVGVALTALNAALALMLAWGYLTGELPA